jgi:signal transduction histidine kinase
MATEITEVPSMENIASPQTDELTVPLVGRMQEKRADLIVRYRRSLQETLFTNRSEVRPREISAIAEGTADALISALPYPQKGVEHGTKLCQMGLSEQTILGLNHATRQFILAIFERDLFPLALDAIERYQNAVVHGFIQGLEKLILSEQERIRGALQIAVGRYTVEIKDIQDLAQRTAESNEFKTRFIARISHELRTPLGALLGMSEMLQQSVYGPLTPAQMDITQRIINNTHILERTFAEFLDQSQLESGQLRLKQEEFSPHVLVQMVHSNNLPLALQKRLTMYVEVDPTLPDILYGDKGRIEQILSNLVINAIKYTQNGGVEINVRSDGATHWLLQVKDTGIGISEENLNFIFEPFRQADETLVRKFGGVGLGLAIVKQLVTAMNGDVRVESKIGEGSTFTVVLPLHTKKN